MNAIFNGRIEIRDHRNNGLVFPVIEYKVYALHCVFIVYIIFFFSCRVIVLLLEAITFSGAVNVQRSFSVCLSFSSLLSLLVTYYRLRRRISLWNTYEFVVDAIVG